MSTYRFTLRRYKHTCVPFFLACCGLFLALQILLASAVFASSSRALAFTAVVLPADQKGFARARVSVVRLLTTFKGPNTEKNVCTGLGVIVASNDADITKQTPSTLWVLTESSLVSGECLANQTNETLARAEIYFNTAYTGDVQPGQKSLVINAPKQICTDGPTCAPGQAAFLSFQGKASPFLAFASSAPSQTSKTNTSSFALVLNQKDVSAVTGPDPTDMQQVTQSLIPQLGTDNTTGLEPGTPFIDADGYLTGIQLANNQALKVGSIQALIDNGRGPDALPVNSSNQVNTSWEAGINAFYKQPPDHRTARTEFEKAHQANAAIKDGQYNNLFLGGQDFIFEANTPIATATPQPQGDENPFSFPLWQASILLVVVLIIVVVVGSLVNRLRVRKRQQDDAKMNQRHQKAEIEARRIREEDAQKRDQAQHFAEQPTVLPVNPLLLQAKAVGNQQIPCPACSMLVPDNAHYCPHCNQVLSPSDLGINKRLVLQSESHAPSSSYPVPASSVSEQPTLQQLPTLDSSEHPTVELRPKTITKRFSDLADERTRIIPSKPLGFIVGTQTNPGIKRKYKPNEDSLLAAQGMISMPSPQLFGLFVVADGMGGHANGQDASRLAIQSIVNDVLPKLVSGNAEIVDYAQVIRDGIQSANQAVHQHNMDQRADMGTTVTSVLIVGNIAYIANVGDSRTYLYHESQRLRKVTNDHSVVASLVEAGIIKYDDIYTHPKRNQIYRSLGEKANVEIDVFFEELHEGDKLLLCSDGLWDMVRDPQIEEVIKRPVSNPSQTSEALIQSALDGGGEDNVSVIVVQLTDSQNAKPMPRIELLAKPEELQVPPM